MKKLITPTIINLVILWLIYYFAMPTLAWGFTGWMFSLILVGIVYLFFGTDKFGEFSFQSPASIVGVSLVSSMLFLLIFVGFINTSEWVNHDDYRNLLGKAREIQNSRDMKSTDINKIIFIDSGVASRFGDKQVTTSENLAMGSQIRIGNYTQQIIRGDVYYVAPLLHSGFWAYNQNGNIGTNGYIIVDAVNPKNSKLVTKKTNGELIQNVYQYDGFFSKNLERHIRSNGYNSVGLTDFSYELDDNLNPWWVVTLYDKKIGYSGNDATGVVVVDPKTGEITEYNMKNLPAWIERVQPFDFIYDQIGWWGEYIDGYWNWSDKGKLELTQSPSLAYGSDGVCYYYAGLTSVGKDETSVGFLMVNTRTKEVEFFKSKGATEDKAAASAEGAVQNYNYTATHARFYNLGGVFTFAFGLTDNEGLVKKYAFVNYEDYAISGIGDNAASAYRDYKAKLSSKGNILVGENMGSFYEIKGKIIRMSVDVKDGNTFYYVFLDNQKNKVFTSTSDVGIKLALSKVGDDVAITFNDGSDGIINIQTFDNLSINLHKTNELIGVEKRFKQVDSLIESEKNEIDVKSAIENLTDTEKAALLKKIRNK